MSGWTETCGKCGAVFLNQHRTVTEESHNHFNKCGSAKWSDRPLGWYCGCGKFCGYRNKLYAHWADITDWDSHIVLAAIQQL